MNIRTRAADTQEGELKIKIPDLDVSKVFVNRHVKLKGEKPWEGRDGEREMGREEIQMIELSSLLDLI